MPGKWDQYAAPATGGNQWDQYAAPANTAPAPTSGAIPGAAGVPDPITENKELANKVSLWEGLKGAGKGVASTLQHIHDFNAPADSQGPIFTPSPAQPLLNMDTRASNPDQIAGKVAESAAELALPAMEGAKALPSASRAGAVFNDIAGKAGNLSVPLSKSAAPLQRTLELGEMNGLPTAVNNLAKRSQSPIPLSFKNARDYVSSISGLSGDEANKLAPLMKGPMGELRTGLHGDIGEALKPLGLNDAYTQAVNEYRQAMQLRDLGKAALTKALPAGGVLGAIGYDINKLRGH